jgi:hypothetical protein
MYCKWNVKLFNYLISVEQLLQLLILSALLLNDTGKEGSFTIMVCTNLL